MAVSRGGIAFWVGCVSNHGRRQPTKKQSWTLSQAVDWLWIRQTRPLSSASWALAPPNSLRYQNVKQPVLSHPFNNASRPQRGGYYEESWEESLSVCVLVPQEPMPGSGLKSRQDIGLDSKPLELPPLHPTTLCSHTEKAEGVHTEGDSEGEEKLAMMYERLRIELPSFFIKNHDYTMYSNDMEFINGLMNTKTRGRVLYHFTLSLWRLLCLCYYAEARLEVLKLTKHMEDGTIKARWRIRGLPVHSLLLRFYRKDKSHLYRSYDAFSTFYIGQNGLIHCHKVEKVMPAQPPVLSRVSSLLAGALVALGVQDHRPALNLLPLLLSSLRQSKN
ncbi:uncharacterized protein C6orf136 homolog isoform X2 [Xiphias gladius]|uniref:uncharacterized protein C6orf136 homolog isoform X2 n=1 Tax=Xiphias gladius TaxID=8245 RepID=UPI001A9895C4|nr:uncharacterized protein C6orf136 homolog isoform X2 [Xiphias gladius]